MHVNFNFTLDGASGIKLIMSEHVLKNDNVHGQCISADTYPRISIYRRNTECDFDIDIEKQEKIMLEGLVLFCTDFVIRNVSATCQYRCAASHLHKTKSVSVAGTYVCG